MKQASFPASQTEAAVLDRHDESSSRAPGGGKRPIPRWVYAVAVGVGLLLVGLILAAIDARPWIHARALAMLRSRFQGQVEIADFHIAFFPIPTVTGRGVVVRHHGRTDVPPLIQIREFSATASFTGLLGKPLHIHTVHLKGLVIQFPPKQPGENRNLMGSSSKDVPVLIDQLVADDAELDMLPANPQKPTHQFLIHQLNMRQVGRGRAAPFVAVLSNPAPPGEIHVHGDFGPWQPDDPRTTPLSAAYTFEHADLSVFKGIAGILTSQGKFAGPLDELQVEGTTTTPDFTVTSGGHPMMLKTEFSATVDGTNGDTLLHPVVAHLLGSILICNGSVIRAPQGKGREVVLEVTATNARIEDLLRLAVKTAQPPMTGRVNLKTKFDLPSPYEGGEVVDRLKLDGKFGIGEMQFTSPAVRGKVESLSDRAQGRPNDTHEDDPLSQLRGDFRLRRAVITLHDLGFQVAGAKVALDGTYGLRSEDLDFHGKVQLQAKPSQMVTGFKSALLRPFDHFLRKNGVTELPIQVTGKRDHPNFGLDFHRKKDPASKPR
jgi:AsmA-like C-terminal region